MARIIVADDDRLVRIVTESVLKGAGHEVVTAKDGDEALQLANEKQPDIVITDIFMPGKNGLEAIVELRDRHPKVRIIAISGNSVELDSTASRDCLDLAKSLGADHVLEKPVASNAILEAVRDSLSRQQA